MQTGCEVRAHDSNIHESEQKANYKWRPSGVRLLTAFGTERIHTFRSMTLGPRRLIGIRPRGNDRPFQAGRHNRMSVLWHSGDGDQPF